MSASPGQQQPESTGCIILVGDGVLWARYDPHTREIHFKRGRKQARFNLSDYDPQEPKPSTPHGVK